ncbi:MAG: hypothetical protein KY468_03250 [Armatimonadetes bacterium]|nr:hypothetical protein [Armatimonadota bacterium]
MKERQHAMPDEPEDERERMVEDFLQGGPRSEEWRQWREALEKRLLNLKQQRSEGGEGVDSSALDGMIEETEAQINALATEEIISEFVESEIELSLNTIEREEETGGFGGFGENGHEE